jgi:uncharacterized membrane protein YkoI
MLKRIVAALVLVAALAVASPVAHAAGCLPPSQAPRGLSEFLGAIRGKFPGGVIVNACLQNVGGKYIYKVYVQVGGKVVTLTFDARTGP